MTRFETYAQGLADIDRVYQQGLALCKTHTLVYSGHYTFGYMAKRYNLTYIAAASLPLNEDTANNVLLYSKGVRKPIIFLGRSFKKA